MLPYTTYSIDLDGVIYGGNKRLQGVREFIGWLETNSKKYLFLTNNSFATGEQILAKLQRLGIAADAAHLLSAGQAAVQHNSRRFPGGVVYVIGEQPLLDLVRSQHLVVADAHAEKADAVLVGLDRTFDYAKLNSAIRAIRAGAFFITINRDALLPVEDGFIPGCGTLAAAIEAASGVTPEEVGKPEPLLLQAATNIHHTQPAHTPLIRHSLALPPLARKTPHTPHL